MHGLYKCVLTFCAVFVGLILAVMGLCAGICVHARGGSRAHQLSGRIAGRSRVVLGIFRRL